MFSFPFSKCTLLFYTKMSMYLHLIYIIKYLLIIGTQVDCSNLLSTQDKFLFHSKQNNHLLQYKNISYYYHFCAHDRSNYLSFNLSQLVAYYFSIPHRPQIKSQEVLATKNTSSDIFYLPTLFKRKFKILLTIT